MAVDTLLCRFRYQPSPFWLTSQLVYRNGKFVRLARFDQNSRRPFKLVGDSANARSNHRNAVCHSFKDD
jgi:hypothetical protein